MTNILLLFLSDVKTDTEAGTIVVRKTTYQNISDTEKNSVTETTNESSVRYLATKKARPDKIFYFASKKVKAPIKNFQVDGKEISHVEYFANRIAAYVVGDVKTVMQECEFDEEADMSKTMESVIDMASKIQKYIETQKVSEVTLHVDMTGGMRHASLMMLVITRLIQYSGVKMGYVLYSNFNRGIVEESNEIYNLFDLIAGAEEFIRFGSVDAIQNYFKGKKDLPTVLQNLLGAMKKFAEAIKISRRSEFQEALQGLQDAYEKFNAESGKVSSPDYNLMQQLKSRISQEYATLLEKPADDYVSIIDWCLAHGYIQQSLVLYTESFPYLLITKDAIIDVDPNLKDTVTKQAEKDKMKREWQYFLLNEYTPKDRDKIFNVYEKFFAKLKIAIQSIRKNKFNMEDIQNGNWISKGIIKSDYDTYLKLLEDLQELKSNHKLAADLNTVAKNLPALYSFRDLIPETIFQLPANGRENVILKTLEGTNNEDFPRKSDNVLITKHMIMQGDIKLNIAEEKFLPIIERYFVIKSERNDSVHARQLPKELLDSEESEISYAAILKNYLTAGLKEYSDIL